VLVVNRAVAAAMGFDEGTLGPKGMGGHFEAAKSRSVWIRMRWETFLGV
jgi:hypothetical protein